MENKAHAMAAGAFVLLVTALLALLAIWLTRDNTQRNFYEMSTAETISGLQPQSVVRFRGVPVGKVELIGFDTKNKGNVLVRVLIAPPVAALSRPSPLHPYTSRSTIARSPAARPLAAGHLNQRVPNSFL